LDCESEEDFFKATLRKLGAVYGDIFETLHTRPPKNIDELKEMLAGIQTGPAALVGADTLVEECNNASDLRSKLVSKNAVSYVIFLA
jgi:hypothetical protein